MIPPLIQIPAKKCTCECAEPPQPPTPEVAIIVFLIFLLPLILIVTGVIRGERRRRKETDAWNEKHRERMKNYEH